MNSTMNAISVENVSFSYGSNEVLNDICVEIKCKQIYALLGPSGGGKTTLLRLILGRIKPKNGCIRVMGDEPDTGLTAKCATSYMPQDCALCQHFTINQTVNYFKNIYRLSQEDYKRRYKALHEMLDLPKEDLFVSHMSGGQQRRLSLAIALINKPSIAILDEPTVGIDPILRQKIWKYLSKECSQGLTAVIVTHYVEEATNADRVGLMRNGRILAEDNPTELMQRFTTNSLENVFLRLCLTEDNANGDIEKFSYKKRIDWYNSANKPTDYDYNRMDTNLFKWFITCFLVLLTLMHKNILKFFHLSVAILIITLPATQALLFCIIYSKDMIQLKTLVVNDELVPKYSELLLSSLVDRNRHIIKPVTSNSIAQAVYDVQRLSAIAAIHFRNNFSDAIDDRIEFGIDADNQTVIDSTVGVYIDNSILMYANGVVDSLIDTFVKLMSQLYRRQNQTFVQSMAISVEKTAKTQNLLMRDYYMPAFYLFYLYLSQITLSSLLLTQERKDGLFERSLIAGVNHELVFVSHFITSCLLSAIQIIFLYITGFLLFNTGNNGSLTVLFAYLISQSICGISLGLMISSFISRDIACIIIVWFITIPQFFSSGFFWPLESLNPILRFIFYYFSPMSIPIETMRNIVLRGWDLNHSHIRYGFLYSLIPSIIYLLIALTVFKRK